MGLGVAEIRERAESLKEAIALERYEAKAGLKGRTDFASVYEAHALVTGQDVVPVIQRELARATGEEERRLRSLLAWVADQQVEASLAAAEDEYVGWESGAGVVLDEREVGLRQFLPALENEPNRPLRVQLEALRNQRLEEALPLQVDILHREREAIAELGFGPFVDARERLSGLNVHGMEREALRILAATEDAYREHLLYQASRRVRIQPDQLRRSDARWLMRMGWLDDYFQLRKVLDGALQNLAELGLPIQQNGQVSLDLEARRLKARMSFSAAIRVPQRIVLVVSPSGGWSDCQSFLHELGHTLHFAYTSEHLPFEYRALGDTAVTESYAVLFELLVLEPAWVRRAVGMDGKELEDYLNVAGFMKLYRIRWLAAMLLYELELHAAERPGQMGARYAEIMSGATGFRFAEQTYLEDVGRGFWTARQLRAWMLSSILHAVLRDRYDVDWFRNPAAGSFLGELLSWGQRDDSGQLAIQLGEEQLSAVALLDRAASWLP